MVQVFCKVLLMKSLPLMSDECREKVFLSLKTNVVKDKENIQNPEWFKQLLTNVKYDSNCLITPNYFKQICLPILGLQHLIMLSRVQYIRQAHF